jgi:hypothetical protein
MICPGTRISSDATGRANRCRPPRRRAAALPQSEVDCRRGQPPGFQFKPVSKHHYLVNAVRGSEQCRATESSIANRQDNYDSGGRRVIRMAPLAKSRCGNRRTRLGICFQFLRLIDECSPYPLVKSNQIASTDGNAVSRDECESVPPLRLICLTWSAGPPR